MKTLEIIAGEYPPGRGGVADYTASLAEVLVQRGRAVRVWQRGNEAQAVTDPHGVVQHRCAGDFTGHGLIRLGHELDQLPGPRRLLVQYVPHAFGCKGMNVGFSEWVRSRALKHHDDVRIMFHEVAYPWVRWPLHHNLMAATNRWMAYRMIQGASQIYVSTEAWNKILIKLGARPDRITTLPIPSNIPMSKNLAAVEIVRRSMNLRSRQNVVGHFGTYGKWVVESLSPIIDRLFSQSENVHLHLIGGRSDTFRDELIAKMPSWASCVSATGRLECDAVADHIAACDVMLQPYPDGANTRRTTLMACLINARATVTTAGPSCERLWRENGIVLVAEQGNPDSAVHQILGLMGEKKQRISLGETGCRYYLKHFSLERTLEALLLDSNCGSIDTSL